MGEERGFRAPPKRTSETGASRGYQRGSHSNRDTEEKTERFPHRGSAPSSTQQPKRLVCSPAGVGGAGSWGSASVRSQGEDWGWRREHSLKALAHHSWLGGSPGKSLQLPKRQETFSCLFVSWHARRGDSELCLNELQRRARAVAISADPSDGRETLGLLLPPPKSLCASTGHSPHRPSREPVQPATARVPGSGDNIPGRTHCAPQAGATLRRPRPPKARPASSVPLPLPPRSLGDPEPPKQLLL